MESIIIQLLTVVLILFSLFISACSPGQILRLALTSTLTATPTATPAPTATFTYTPTFTPTPIPFKAGIPETMKACQAWELPVNADGTLDKAKIQEAMQELSRVEHKWLDEQGITAADVGVFSPVGDITGNKLMPYPFIRMSMQYADLKAVSCVRISFKGHEYMIYGIAGKRSQDSTQVGIIHGVYDDIGNEQLAESLNQLESFQKQFSSKPVFEAVRDNKFYMIDYFLGGYGKSANQEILDRWKLTQALEKNNNITGDIKKDSDAQLMSYAASTDYKPTAEEEAQLIRNIEGYIYPVKVIFPNVY